MDARKLDVGQVIGFAWEMTKANLSLLIVVAIVGGLATGIPSWIAEATKRSAPGLSFLFRLAGFVLTMLVGIGGVRIALRLHDGQTAAVRDLFSADWSLFWRYAVSTILYGLIVGIGFIFLVVPGVIFGVRYFFYPYFVFERGARPVAALAQSAAATEGVRWDVFILGFALLLLNMVGALLLLIGLLVTIPLSYLSVARAYRLLTGAGTAA